MKTLDTVKLLVKAGADPNLRGTFEPDYDFPLNIAALSCNQYVFNSHAYARNRAIFNYLAPLTSPKLRTIAQKSFNIYSISSGLISNKNYAQLS